MAHCAGAGVWQTGVPQPWEAEEFRAVLKLHASSATSSLTGFRYLVMMDLYWGGVNGVFLVLIAKLL